LSSSSSFCEQHPFLRFSLCSSASSSSFCSSSNYAELAAAACAALLVVYISGCNNELCNGLMFCMLLDHPMTLWI
jgi:hypothetical protein